MEEDAKALFRWKFYGLTVELNIIVLLVALSVIVFFIVRSPYTPIAILVMLILALVLSLDFAKRYRETKAWLYAQPEKSKEGEDSKENDKTE
jgi:membrane protein YdbS with pleckstrin-like domain